MNRVKVTSFAALMGALAIVLSVPPLAIPISFGAFESSVHFFQLAVFLSGILAGPVAGMISGAVGGIYMGVTRIPFVIGGIAILGGAAGLFAKRVRPLFAGLLAWAVQAPYVVVTDYAWFTLLLPSPLPPAAAWSIITGIMIKLVMEAVVCSILAEMLVPVIKRADVSIIQSPEK